jgi:hypothetical protein
MIVVTEIGQTCHACPSQWEGRTDDGDYIYVRFRWGFLAIGKGPTIEDAIDNAYKQEEIFGRQLKGSLDGFLTYEELIETTKGFISWPETYS